MRKIFFNYSYLKSQIITQQTWLECSLNGLLQKGVFVSIANPRWLPSQVIVLSYGKMTIIFSDTRNKLNRNDT